MTQSFHGMPCWFELGTSDIDGAAAFYGKVLGWTVGGREMPEFDYHLARIDGEMVAGVMGLEQQPPGTPPNWLLYVAVDSADDTARQAAARGGTVLKEPADIPGTGRFAVLADPQGAVFGILQPDMSQMSEAEQARAAENQPFDQKKPGHGHWLELMSTDPKAGFDFYAELFGWTRGEAMPMGEAGDYQLFRKDGADIGGMMGLGGAPMPVWLVYFGVPSAEAAAAAIREAEGEVRHGPMEVPGGGFVVLATDPQGAWFAVVGGK